MKINHIVLFLNLFWVCFIIAETNNFTNFINEMLSNDSKYLQKENRLKMEIAEHKIEQSVNWFDVNFSYRTFSNDKTREQIEDELEYSKIDEDDERWKIELSKQFFPKDYDDTNDNLTSKINILRFQYETNLYRISRMESIIDDFIEYYEAINQVLILKDEIEILNHENLILEELHSKNILQPEDLIKNIKELHRKENELSNWEEIYAKFSISFFERHQEFNKLFDDFIKNTSEIPDSISFHKIINKNITNLNKKTKKITASIKRKKIYFFLPELNFSLSYNHRKTLQDWNITENKDEYSMERNFVEKYPEGEIELSLPFNIFSNYSGKKQLLKSFEKEIKIHNKNILISLKTFELERINSFHKALNNYQRKIRLEQLYNEQYTSQKIQFETKPDLLGVNPETKLLKEEIKIQKAMLQKIISEMKLYKEIFLINYFGENNYEI
ncbi:MAG: hypothetical protein K8S23_17065 [Candidatus Cloacimonetes bacterium]|nr:hypothetical protein [Candidatus Cloacimonadota bacterium]